MSWLTLFSIICISCNNITLAQFTQGFAALTNFNFLQEGLYQGSRSNKGLPEGDGLLVYFTDDLRGRYNYSGTWREGRRHGQGITFFRNGDSHQGNYEDDKPQGRGLKSYHNGDEFEGFFDKGLRKGSGTLRYANGTRRDGEWEDDKLHGFAFYHHSGSDSPRVERWQNGVRVSSEETLQSNIIPTNNVIPEHEPEDEEEEKQQDYPVPGQFVRSSKVTLLKRVVQNNTQFSQTRDAYVKRRRRLFDFVNKN